MKIKNISTIFLSLGLILSPYKAHAAEQDFPEIRLQQQGSISPYKALLFPPHQGVSPIYGVGYPKIPRIHAYDHNLQENYFCLQDPIINSDSLREDYPDTIVSLLEFKKVKPENVSVFVLAQSNEDPEEEILLRPHYFFTGRNIVDPTNYLSVKRISAGIFPLEKSSIYLEGQPENSLLKGIISIHSDNNMLIASPNNFHIKNFKNEEGALFLSLVIEEDYVIYRSLGTEQEEAFFHPIEDKRAALTIHYIPSRATRDEVRRISRKAVTLQDLLALEKVRTLFQPGKLQIFPSTNPLTLPVSFNWELYRDLNPSLNDTINDLGWNPQKLEPQKYFETLYIHHGHKHGHKFLPANFSWEIYRDLNPDVKDTINDLGWNPQQLGPKDYFERLYAYFGYKKGHRYFPIAFNWEVYRDLNSHLKDTVNDLSWNPQQLEPQKYFETHYIHHGHKLGYKFLPANFNWEVYRDLNPSLKDTINDLGWNPQQLGPKDYFERVYAYFGYKQGHKYSL